MFLPGYDAQWRRPTEDGATFHSPTVEKFTASVPVLTMTSLGVQLAHIFFSIIILEDGETVKVTKEMLEFLSV